jgi:hypothetical protein
MDNASWLSLVSGGSSADAEGGIEILDVFWDFDDQPPMTQTVPPLLAFADLIATLPPVTSKPQS